MPKHPYENLPDTAFWRRAVAELAADAVDPVVAFPFRFGPDDKVVTAGSCFAQHISQRLAARGFHHFVAELANPILSQEMAARFNYGVYSARYGNIYTARQLRQLAERAYGRCTPTENIWESSDGRFIDPFRPTIQPGGFATRSELLADRAQHLAAVRRALEELDVFVFTLGLTECWVSRADGAAFPVCPGVSGGVFREDLHQFRNFDVNEITADLEAFFDLLAEVNPNYRAILTVSPVPLIATAEDRHVLVSTVWSKSVLRVAAEKIARANPRIAYFPSYEIVTGSFARGRYFADDLRSVTNAGVDHVMAVFFSHATEGAAAHEPVVAKPAKTALPHRQRVAEEVTRIICDEEAIEESSR
jgi:hypothetical protein